MNDSGPQYLKDLLKKNNTRALRDNGKLYVPRTSTKTFGDCAFSVAAPRLWNNIPADVRAIDNLNGFKRSIQTLLFNDAFTSN